MLHGHADMHRGGGATELVGLLTARPRVRGLGGLDFVGVWPGPPHIDFPGRQRSI